MGSNETSPCTTRKETDPCNVKVTAQYKFYAAFENSRCRGYVTEKFFRGLLVGMVPVALGGMGRKDYEAIVSGDAFLHIDDFESVEALAKKLIEIDKNDAEYDNFHA